MNYFANMLFLCFCVCAHSSELAVLSDLHSLKWNHRIVLVNDLHNPQDIVALFEKNKGKISERDLIWFVLKGNQVNTNYSGVVAEDFVTKTRDSYKIGAGKIMLIGKDGGVKFLLDRLDLEAIFSEIDAMPMRKNEMVH
ncbi:MAG: hypothetical protein A2203_00740 [Chromatiales bacterium RIFOXYA1_FULL_46_5]|nr:MAG: hypothetical protein A2203_00740 [Chromatiales bacterium RIFOXYA1_FULL_46_5]